ncbi:hypothetical protein FB451DRAFT_1173654 [Mycena latifolia]|nr:hypothetical protein FB451DRAFT_1173654 [Mycena latifolia]
MNPASIYEVPGAKKYWRMWIMYILDPDVHWITGTHSAYFKLDEVSAGSVTQIAYMEYREASRERENGENLIKGCRRYSAYCLILYLQYQTNGDRSRSRQQRHRLGARGRLIRVGETGSAPSKFNYGTNPREDRQQLRIKNIRNIINSGTGRRGVGEKATRTPRRNEMQAAGTNDVEGRMLKNAVRHDSSIIGGCSAGAWARKGGRNGGEGGDPMIARAARGDARIESNCAREEKNDRQLPGDQVQASVELVQLRSNLGSLNGGSCQPFWSCFPLSPCELQPWPLCGNKNGHEEKRGEVARGGHHSADAKAAPIKILNLD